MYTLLRLLPLRRVFREQLPVLLVAWVIAELFYKFHSFSLECAAFLATWFVLDAALQGLRHLVGARAGPAGSTITR
jgi:hypothetical protein